MSLFRNEREGRLRAFWRLLFQFALSFVGQSFLTTIALVIFALAAEVEDAGGFLGLADLPLFVVVSGAASLLATVASVWLAGRFMDRRPILSGFGLRLDRAWWLDFGFGLGLGGARGLRALVLDGLDQLPLLAELLADHVLPRPSARRGH